MDCLNVQSSKTHEPYLLGTASSQPTHAPRGRTSKIVRASIFLLSLLFLALLGVIIWLAVEVNHNKGDIRALNNRLGVATQSALVPTATTPGSASALTAVSAAYPAVYLSQNATSQPGYAYAGSLYRGSGYWAEQPPLDAVRADFIALNVNGTLFVLGGHDGSNNYLVSGISYDPLQNLTGNVSNMPSARSHFAAGTTDNTTIVIAGGYSNEANENSNTPEKCSLVYNVSANTWSTGACLTEARGSSCGAVVNGKFFVAGGLGANGKPLSSIEVYHPSNNTWTTFAQLPSARSDSGCAASGNNLIIAGGTDSTGKTDLKEVWAVDSTRGNLTRKADMLYARFDLQLVSLPGGDVLAVGGGQHVNNSEEGLHNVERFSKASNQWVEKAMISNQRFAFGAAFINEGVYALGGHIYCNDTASEDCGNGVLSSVEVFYDSDHPDVFLHLQRPGATLNGPAPNNSQVLLLTTDASVNGYQAAGSLYRGSGYWGTGQDIPQALSDLNVVGYGNTAFIVGGLDLSANDAVDTLYKYDPILDQYSNMSKLPEPRTRGAADILGDNLYYVGGFDSGADTAEPLDSMLVYNIPNNTWTVASATLSSPRSDLCMAAVNGTLYAAGGYSTNYTETLNLAEKYDPNTKSWTAIKSMPTPGGDVMCAAMNGLFVVAGGYYDPTGQFLPASFRTTVQAYNPSTDEWTDLASLPVARGDAAMTVVPSQFGDRLVVMGGETEVDNLHTGVATHQVQEYSSALNQWILKAPMITPRFRHDCTYVEGHIITFGGASSSICGDDGSGLQVCTLRPVATVEEFFDTDNPDVFVYVAN